MDKITTNIDLSIIRNNIDCLIHQVKESLSEEKIFNNVVEQIKSNMAFGIQRNKFIMIIIPETMWIGQIYIFSENKRYSIKDFRLITEHFFRNTPARKLYGRFSDERITNLVVRGGWKIEGRLTKAFVNSFDGSGELKDLIIAGACREDFV